MYLKFGYFVLYTPIYRLMEKTKLSMWNGRCKKRLWARAPCARQGSCGIW